MKEIEIIRIPTRKEVKKILKVVLTLQNDEYVTDADIEAVNDILDETIPDLTVSNLILIAAFYGLIEV